MGSIPENRLSALCGGSGEYEIFVKNAPLCPIGLFLLPHEKDHQAVEAFQRSSPG